MAPELHLRRREVKRQRLPAPVAPDNAARATVRADLS